MASDVRDRDPGEYSSQHVPNERSPLLERLGGSLDETHNGRQHSKSTPSSYRLVVLLIALFSLVADLGGGLVDTPEVRLLELAVCRDYYLVHDPSVIGRPPLSYVEEELCKLDAIQVELAYLRTMKSILMMLPGSCIAVPLKST